MAEVKHRTFSHVVEGLPFPGIFPEENIRSAINYKPHPEDIFLMSYPKCGTTWAQHLMTVIVRKGVPVATASEMFAVAPFIEATGEDAVLAMLKPGVIRGHLPYNLTPYSPEVKYVYITRNPKDCCVSYFYHMRNMPGHQFDGSFDEFFELFISGEIDYGDYFDHVLKWYEHRNDPNVLFITYEEMKADAKAAAMKVASFLGEEFANLLRENPKIWDDVVYYSSFEYMKQKVNDSFDEISKMDDETIKNDPLLHESMKQLFLGINAIKSDENKVGNNFVRKGIIGDWRNHFSPEQNKRMDEKIAQKLEGTGLLDYWKDCL